MATEENAPKEKKPSKLGGWMKSIFKKPKKEEVVSGGESVSEDAVSSAITENSENSENAENTEQPSTQSEGEAEVIYSE